MAEDKLFYEIWISQGQGAFCIAKFMSADDANEYHRICVAKLAQYRGSW